jgi:hypothetical protein
LSFSDEINYKINKVYNILDQMLSRCRGTLTGGKLSDSFKNVNSSIEILQKIGDQNKLIGIFICFKYFKAIINKYYKMGSKKKQLDSLVDLNKLNDKLDTLSQKIGYLEKNILFKSPIIQSENTSCISDTIVAVDNDSHTNTRYEL